MLIPLPMEGERENNADEALRCNERLTDYNRRFSSERRPVSFFTFLDLTLFVAVEWSKGFFRANYKVYIMKSLNFC